MCYLIHIRSRRKHSTINWLFLETSFRRRPAIGVAAFNIYFVWIKERRFALFILHHIKCTFAFQSQQIAEEKQTAARRSRLHFSRLAATSKYFEVFYLQLLCIRGIAEVKTTIKKSDWRLALKFNHCSSGEKTKLKIEHCKDPAGNRVRSIEARLFILYSLKAKPFINWRQNHY